MSYFGLKKVLVISSVVVALITLLIVLYILPTTFSDSFFSCRFEPRFLGEPEPIHPAMRVEISDGRVLYTTTVGFKVWYNNSYFIPVKIPYNGFDQLVLIYNATVDDPTDVVENNDFLIWGAFYNPYIPGEDMGELTGEYYEYYLASKDLNNFTKSIKSGAHSSGPLFVSSGIGEPIWKGQDLNGNPISPGTYYLYTVLYGKVANPQPYELAVLEVYWPS